MRTYNVLNKVCVPVYHRLKTTLAVLSRTNKCSVVATYAGVDDDSSQPVGSLVPRLSPRTTTTNSKAYCSSLSCGGESLGTRLACRSHDLGPEALISGKNMIYAS